MTKSAPQITVLLFAGLLLGACETLDSATQSSANTISGWYDSTTDALSGDDYDPSRNYIANQVGEGLTDADALAIERESVRALETASDGETVRWTSSNSGASASITPAETAVETREVKTPHADGVAAAPSLILIGQTYRAVKSANVRAAPGTENPVIDKLSKGSRFTAIGKVDGADWIMVARGGKAVGYVFAPLVKRDEESRKTVPPLRKTLAEDEDARTDGMTMAEVTFATSCRSLEYTVTLSNGDTEEDSFRACKAADGAWEID